MTWMQQMFTPERSGSYQWQNRPDQGGGEFTGEIEGVYEGDAQDLRFVPRANRGRPTTSPGSIPKPLQTPLPQTGTGVNPLSQIGRDMGALAGGNESGFDTSPIVEDVSVSESGPSGSIGASIAESMQPRQTMTPGSSRWSGVSMNDNWIDPNQATNAFNAGGYEAALQDGMSIDGGGQNIPVKSILSANPLERIRAMRAGHNVDYSGGTNNPDPNSALTKPGAMHLMDLFRGLNPTTPKIPDGGAPITQKESPMSMFQPSNFVNPLSWWMKKMGG
jgi:hypothetical protein